MPVPLSVLLIEDSANDAALIIRQLEKAEYSVVARRVETAGELKEALIAQGWDIIIADYRLPEFDAPSALALLQETGFDIPFIVISGAIGEETAVALMRSGARDYLMKGNLARLAPVIKRELSQVKMRREQKQAEDLLRKSQEQYRYLVELSPDAIFVNRGDRIDFVNPAALELFGASSPKQLLGKSPYDVFHPDYHSIVAERVRRMTDLHEAVPLIEEKIDRLDGSVRDVEGAAAPFTDKDGDAIQVILRDITERKQTEAQLRANEERYRVLFEHSPISIWEEDFSALVAEIRRLQRAGARDFRVYLDQHPEAIFGLAGLVRIININQKGMQLFEVRGKEDFKRPMTDFLIPEGELAFKEELVAFAEGKTSYCCEIPNRTLGGEPKILAMNLVVAPGYEDTCSKVLLSFIDITEQRRAEEKIRQLFESTRRDAARAEALARTAARLTTSLDLQAVVNTICEEAALALDSPAATLILYDEAAGELRLAADYGFPADYRERHHPIKIDDFQKIAAHSGEVGGILDLFDYPSMPNFSLNMQYNARYMLLVQLTRDKRTMGALNVFALQDSQQFSKDDLNLLQGIADQAAQAIENARLFEQVSAGRRHLRALSQKLVEVQEAERRKLALELHDELGQMLNSVKMSLDMAHLLPTEAAHEQLVRAQALVTDLVARVRRMSLELRPSMLDDMGLLPALRWLFKNYRAQTGEEIIFEYNNIDQRFSPQVEITAYRITQEALTNIIRHAGCPAGVNIDIWADEQALNLQIQDHGHGFAPAAIAQKHESSGLSGMRERARLIGGELVIESEPGAGAALTARLPFIASNETTLFHDSI